MCAFDEESERHPITGKLSSFVRRDSLLFEIAIHLGPAILVGLGGGVGAIIFRWLIQQVTTISFSWLPKVTSAWGLAYIVIAPTVGGLLVGLLISNFAPEAKGHGVPEVMEAVALRGGRIRPIVVLIKSLASSLSIGSGGSVGREGPIVQIGSALGSTIGQKLHLSEDRVRNLVGCGAAAGIAATFNAPIAGFIFAMEVILGDFGIANFSSVAISAVLADVIGRIAFGDVPAFTIPAYELRSLWEYPFYAIMGVVAAAVAVLYVRLVYWSEDAFDSVHFIPSYAKPAIGGLLLGLTALAYPALLNLPFENVPHIFGVGYETIEVALLGKLALGTALALMLLKILSTSLTIGSGGSGGIFAPSLFIGACLGAGIGVILNHFMPDVIGPVGAYALVGMGAVFAGAAHAPITAVLILFELTDDYRIILPLILTAGIATILSHTWMKGESIYTLKLSRRGIRLRFGRDVDLMESVRVAEVMSTKPVTVGLEYHVKALPELFLQTHAHAFPVVDKKNKLIGIVSLTDYRRVSQRNAIPAELRVSDICTRVPIVAFPDESVQSVLRRMAPRDLSLLPVVSREDESRLLGIIQRNDIVKAYDRAAIAKPLNPPTNLLDIPGAQVVDYILKDISPAANKRLAELTLPSECMVVSILRGGSTVIPHGDTLLQEGDRVKILLYGCDVSDLAHLFHPGG
jgi:CIC family chloride channel protein